ncbi:preprotein translocase subunit SecD [Sinobacterium caligoides]|uniref:Protein translocase subunit SecD n=1 Tax=Sinobacterium caligoides TaxID=933926 RepID=A0A3N2DZ83_9GAMM|nr:protein translocase subunit SecD [Sinobacterium caligoides]ROS05183.1 preprotein translocase subunit SecD [Sinobacterium caligoides]
MLKKYPLWKYLFLLVVMVMGFIYSAPNLYRPDPAIQISHESSGDMTQAQLTRVTKALDEGGVDYFGSVLNGRSALIRVHSGEMQLRAKAIAQRALGDDYIVAINLAETTPKWLRDLGAEPMKLGLDLSGGVHFLLEVDTQTAVKKRQETNLVEIKRLMRAEKIRGLANLHGNEIRLRFSDEEKRSTASSAIRKAFPNLERRLEERGEHFWLLVNISATEIAQIEDHAVSQNLTTLRNRVNELGVSEPLVAKQGRNRIVVELPGVQDTAQAKNILGKTATLEFRLEAKPNALMGTKEKFEFRNPERGQREAWLNRQMVISGENVQDARSAFDENGRPQVSITLDGNGGTLMNHATRKAIGERLGVLFVERKSRTIGYEKDDKGVEHPIKQAYDNKKIISLATVQSALGVQFRITGLDSSQEASDLALLLRAGALAAPLDFVEERTIGPSLGAENIEMGLLSVQIGLGLVVIFMLLYYKVFGLLANIALASNVVLLIALMSILGATLTLPGIAGIVLTVGMAVDANVLIFSRIKEELNNGAKPALAINAGFDRAVTTIMDANITTLLVAVILYAVGTGPIKGFAVTLALGIMTSMFTAIMGTRALICITHGRRELKKLWI